MKIDKYEKIGVGKYRLSLSNGEVLDIYDDVIVDNELLKKLDETDATEYICRILLLNTLSLMNK